MKTALKIVSIVGLVFWTACCFLGLYFASDGKLMVAIPITLLLAVALFLSYLLMLKMQDKGATQGNRDRARTVGFIMLGVYVIATLVSAFYINHLVKTFESKDAIQTTAYSAIEELRVTFSKDENPNSYRAWVAEEKEHYRQHLLVHPEELGENSLDRELDAFEDVLISEDYENLEDLVNASVNQIKASVVNSWYLPTLLTRLKELERKSEWEAQAVALSRMHDYTQDDPFVPVSRVNSANLSYPLTNADFGISVAALLIMLALQVIILLGYLLSLKTGGKNDKIVTDDHGSTRSWA